MLSSSSNGGLCKQEPSDDLPILPSHLAGYDPGDDWYMPSVPSALHGIEEVSFSLPPMGSSSTLFPSTVSMGSSLEAVCADPSDTRFDLAEGGDGFGSLMNAHMPPPAGEFSGGSRLGFEYFRNLAFLDRPKFLWPLDGFLPAGPQRWGKGVGSEVEGEERKMMEGNGADEMDEASIDGWYLNSGSEEDGERNVKREGGMEEGGGGICLNGNFLEAAGGRPRGDKRKRKRGPAKNLTAERRRRQRLNDRLYMLRSIVPKISKMDRVSILVDTIDYVNELLEKIKDIHKELETTSSDSSFLARTMTTFNPSTPTVRARPCCFEEKLCWRSLLGPENHPPRVEVREGEDEVVNVHMFCACKPGILLSTLRALDELGLNIQQASVSCFNGFVLNVFKAEQRNEGPGAKPEEIEAALVHTAGSQSTI